MCIGVVAMGFPATGAAAAYRNNMKDVQRFLNTRHGGHHKVYNLCSELQYSPDQYVHYPQSSTLCCAHLYVLIYMMI
jgi:hypothetical protein